MKVLGTIAEISINFELHIGIEKLINFLLLYDFRCYEPVLEMKAILKECQEKIRMPFVARVVNGFKYFLYIARAKSAMPSS